MTMDYAQFAKCDNLCEFSLTNPMGSNKSFSPAPYLAASNVIPMSLKLSQIKKNRSKIKR